MHDNFENLQKRCKKYHLKKKMKFYVPTFSLIFFLAIFVILNKENTVIKQETTKVLKPLKTKETTQVNKVQEPKKEEKIIEDIPYALQIDKKYLPKQQTYKVEPRYKEEIVPKKLQRVYIKRDKPKTLAITIKKLDSIKDMIAYYNKEKKYSLALKIAQTYYNSKKYSNSLLWSKKANLLNRDADGAWILYAKSEYAIGHHKRAIKILNLYITNADSNEAKTLLLTWTQGK